MYVCIYLCIYLFIYAHLHDMQAFEAAEQAVRQHAAAPQPNSAPEGKSRPPADAAAVIRHVIAARDPYTLFQVGCLHRHRHAGQWGAHLRLDCLGKMQ